MNKNIENYKKAIDNIQANDDLINKTINKANEKKPNKKGNFILYTLASLSTCVAIMLVVIIIIPLHTKDDNTPTSIVAIEDNTKQNTSMEGYIKNFKSQKELDEKIEELVKNTRYYNYSTNKGVISDSIAGSKSFSAAEDAEAPVSSESSSTSSNYSKTNVQVQGVDEADIIKTDGTNIYLVKGDTLYVLDKDLGLVSKKIFDETSVKELYLTSDRIVVLSSKDATSEDSTYYTNSVIKVLDKKTLEVTREVTIKGYLRDSRLIGDDFYIITSMYLYGGDNVKTYPGYEDSVTNNGMKTLDCTDIYYVEEYKGSSFINVCAFNIKNDEEANVESFLGMSTEIYCSLNNLYFINTDYRDNDSNIEILKMKIDNSKMKMESRAILAGEIDDQFSLDEYNGYLRVATTEYIEYNGWFDEDDDRTINHLFVLNDKMEVVGQTEDFGADEEIYSVRFIGDVGYVVTFREIDPLFVMDLSDPTNPIIKGELKVPGFSSYLHPYDETHIIGIGYNVESNGYGGVKTTNMKMSMFDVSDLSNPKELYSVNIGEGNYVSSAITYNHKALLYDQERSLIGFPMSYSRTDGFVIYKIEKDGFKKIVSKENNNLYEAISRIIYIEDNVYALGSTEITSFDIYTMDIKNTYQFENAKWTERSPIVYDFDIVE